MAQYVIKCIRNPCGLTTGQWNDGKLFYNEKPSIGMVDINVAYHLLHGLYGEHSRSPNCGCLAEVVELEK